VVLNLPASIDINSTNLDTYRHVAKEEDPDFQALGFTPRVGEPNTFYLEHLDRGEQRDSLILIWGAILGTGLALLAEALASAIGDFAGVHERG
jgi:hypothetical protein